MPDAATWSSRLEAEQGARSPCEDMAPDLQGPYWLAQRFAEQVERLRALLAASETNWNIERGASDAPGRQ
jgi:hypothetical protein